MHTIQEKLLKLVDEKNIGDFTHRRGGDQFTAMAVAIELNTAFDEVKTNQR